jgi:hypothetical protein
MHKHQKTPPIIPPAAKPVAVPAPPRTAATAAPVAIPPARPIAEEAIRLRAYQKWEMAGKPAGDGVRFWVEAEKELKQGK